MVSLLSAGVNSQNPFPRRGSKRDGFALVAVIWSLGLITLLATAVMVGARYRVRVSSNYTSVAVAEAAAESAINLGLVAALSGGAEQNVKFPLRCQLPGGERVFVSVEEETGKIDLNTASPAALSRFFAALTRDQSLGGRITQRILAFRNPKPSDGRSASGHVPAPDRFSTIMQLDQIDGISPSVFRSALRLVTVRSFRVEPDPEAAPPLMRRLLGLEQKQISATRGLPSGGTVTIRADVRSPDGSRYIREALILLDEDKRKFLVLEWRRGDIDPTFAMPTASGQGAERSCLPMTNVASN